MKHFDNFREKCGDSMIA